MFASAHSFPPTIGSWSVSIASNSKCASQENGLPLWIQPRDDEHCKYLRTQSE